MLPLRAVEGACRANWDNLPGYLYLGIKGVLCGLESCKKTLSLCCFQLFEFWFPGCDAMHHGLDH